MTNASHYEILEMGYDLFIQVGVWKSRATTNNFKKLYSFVYIHCATIDKTVQSASRPSGQVVKGKSLWLGVMLDTGNAYIFSSFLECECLIR